MGNDFNQTYFVIAVATCAAATVVATVAVARAARSDAPATSRASIARLPTVVATFILGAGLFVGTLGAMLDDELMSRPGNRYFVIDATWHLLAAVTDPTGSLNPAGRPGPNPFIPGWFAWFVVSGIVAAMLRSRGWRWTWARFLDRASNLIRRYT